MLTAIDYSIDLQKDTEVHKVLGEHFRKTTIIEVARRPQVLRGCDRVAVMDAGVLIETGRPEELLRNETSAFAQLLRSRRD